MPIDPRKRQRKLERRKKKDAAERKARLQRVSTPPATLIARSAGTPILDCLLFDGIWRQGIGSLLISRSLPDHKVAYAVFLLDVFCLGVKNAMFGVTSRQQYQEGLLANLKDHGARTRISPAHARKLIEDSVAYALQMGLYPHRDYEAASRIFADIDATSCTETFVFGKDGKPLFVAGPHDSREKCQRIMAALAEHCGEGSYHYLMPVSAEEALDIIDSDPQWIEHDASAD